MNIFKKLKNKKGFTLVELIVVLVILAILAALLVPALTGYIDKANQEKVIAECRSVVVASQTTASEYYGLGKPFDEAALTQIRTLAEAPKGWTYNITVDSVNGENNVVTEVKFTDGKSYATYTKAGTEAGTYDVVDSTKGPSGGTTIQVAGGTAVAEKTTDTDGN